MFELKPNFWDLKKPNLKSYIFQPLTLPIRLSNFFSDIKLKYKTKKIVTICIGNIYLGGTGKTPTTIKLFKILNKIYKKRVFTAKKFYKSQLDEASILKKETNYLTSNNRVKILNLALKKRAKILIFDDGLQDKNIDYDLKFVCFDSNSWIGNGQLIPSGPLRENLNSLKKYDLVFLKYINKKNLKIIRLIKKINPKIKVFHTKYNIKNLSNFNLKKQYIVFSGIGNPNSFKQILEFNKFKVIKNIIFPDHYNYKKEDILRIINKSKELKANIITTEKDFAKIPKGYNKNIKFIKIDLKIGKNNHFIKFLKKKIYE